MKEVVSLPKIKGIHWLPISTDPYGWNIKHNRPAKKSENIYFSQDVCMCEYCADDPHYGSHYCKRYGESNERFYSDHHTRWK